jgi:hypothetical protein
MNHIAPPAAAAAAQVPESDLDKKGDGYTLKSDPTIKVHARAHKVHCPARRAVRALHLNITADTGRQHVALPDAESYTLHPSGQPPQPVRFSPSISTCMWARGGMGEGGGWVASGWGAWNCRRICCHCAVDVF